MTERLPEPDGPRVRDTTIEAADLLVVPVGEPMVRIHALGGTHPSAWNEFRAYGPTTSRFDHHTHPARVHPSRRIAYLTRGHRAVTAAVAEYFQDHSGAGVQPIDTGNRRPTMSVIQFTRPLVLLDLDGGWVTRAGGNQAIRTGQRSQARRWSRAIYRYHAAAANLDGLAFSSSIWGLGRCVALWERAEGALPASPTETRGLDDPALLPAIAMAAEDLGSYVL